MSKSFRDEYENNFKPKKDKKLTNKKKRSGTKNFLKNIDLNVINEDEEFEFNFDE
jgi:hypothetical protein